LLTLHQKQILQKALSASQRKAVASADFAGPHDSFPITNQTQVNSAARLAGHAANPDAVRAAIKRIAKRKGLKLPEAWTEKDRNYSAHAGQQIAGRLFRGAGGKFSSGGQVLPMPLLTTQTKPMPSGSPIQPSTLAKQRQLPDLRGRAGVKVKAVARVVKPVPLQTLRPLRKP
jgi:hypothetical protein